MKLKNCYNNILEGVKNLDFIGPRFEFENEDSSRFKSVGGFIFSFIIILSCFIIGFLFGNEIYLKQNPIVSISQEITKYSDVYLKDFPIMFSFTTAQGKNLKLNDLRKYFVLEIYMQNMDFEGIVHKPTENYSMEVCDESKYRKYSDLVSIKKKQNKNKEFLCISHDSDSYFSNGYLQTNSTNFNFIVKKCIQNCSQDIDNIIENMLITIIYPTSFVNFYNFIKPVDLYLDEMTTQSSNFLTRRSYMRFTYNGLNSDNGILLEDIQKENFISLASVVPDDLVYNKEGPSKDTLFWLALESPRIRGLISRKYMKIQELIATLGGLANAFYIIANIVSYHYLRFLYIEYIRESVLEVINKKKETSFVNSHEYSKKDDDLINSLCSNKPNLIKTDKLSSFKIIKENTNRSKATKLSYHVNKKNDNNQHLSINTNNDIVKINNNIAEISQIKNDSLSFSSSSKLESSESSFGSIDFGRGNSIEFNTNKDNKNTKLHEKSTKICVDKNIEPHKNENFTILMKPQNTFFTPSISNKLKEKKQNYSYCNYIFSIMCCRYKEKQIYDIRSKALTDVINIHTFCRLVVLQKDYTNELEHSSFSI